MSVRAVSSEQAFSGTDVECPSSIAGASDEVQPTSGVDPASSFVMVKRNGQNKIDVNCFDLADAGSKSRRVLLTGIPDTTTVAQISNAVTGIGGISSIFIVPDLTNRVNRGRRVGVVEFRFPESAAIYVQNFAATGLDFMDDRGVKHNVQVQQILTPSHAPATAHPRNEGFHDNGLSGRCIVLSSFPTGCIWWLFRDFGVRDIIRARYESNNVGKVGGKLTVEFINTFQATRFCQYIHRACFAPYHASTSMITLGSTACDRPVEEMNVAGGNLIQHVDPGLLEQTWNLFPFNEFMSPSPILPYGSHIPRRPVAGDHQDNSLNDDIQARMKSGETEYILCSGAILFRRSQHEYGFKELVGLELARFKNRTLPNPHWAPFWKEYVEVSHLDILKYHAYGEIAAARRAHNASLGLPPWATGNVLQQTPTPNVITLYCRPSVHREVVSTTDEDHTVYGDDTRA